MLTRVVPADGRSRAYIDGRLATAGSLAEIAERIVDLHGQHAHQSLLGAATQRAALDHFGQVDLAPLRAARAAVTEIDAELAALGGDETVARPRDRPAALPGRRARRRGARRAPTRTPRSTARRRCSPTPSPIARPAPTALAALASDGGGRDVLGEALHVARRSGAVSSRSPTRLRDVLAELDDIAVGAARARRSDRRRSRTARTDPRPPPAAPRSAPQVRRRPRRGDGVPRRAPNAGSPSSSSYDQRAAELDAQRAQALADERDAARGGRRAAPRGRTAARRRGRGTTARAGDAACRGRRRGRRVAPTITPATTCSSCSPPTRVRRCCRSAGSRRAASWRGRCSPCASCSIGAGSDGRRRPTLVFDEVDAGDRRHRGGRRRRRARRARRRPPGARRHPPRRRSRRWRDTQVRRVEGGRATGRRSPRWRRSTASGGSTSSPACCPGSTRRGRPRARRASCSGAP